MKFYLLYNNKKDQIVWDSESSDPVIKTTGRILVKVSCDSKFIITKTGTIEWLCREISNSIGRYRKANLPTDNFYFKFAKYIADSDLTKIIIEPILISENGYNILKAELEQLIQHFGSKSCINTNNIPYIPKTVYAKKGSNWLTQNEMLNFKKLLTKYDY